jgi:hypothetical protein
MSPTTTKVSLAEFAEGAKLRAFRDFFLSSIGPRGRLKVFESSVGHLTVTAASDRMLRSTAANSAAVGWQPINS